MSIYLFLRMWEMGTYFCITIIISNLYWRLTMWHTQFQELYTYCFILSSNEPVEILLTYSFYRCSKWDIKIKCIVSDRKLVNAIEPCYAACSQSSSLGVVGKFMRNSEFKPLETYWRKIYVALRYLVNFHSLKFKKYSLREHFLLFYLKSIALIYNNSSWFF